MIDFSIPPEMEEVQNVITPFMEEHVFTAERLAGRLPPKKNGTAPPHLSLERDSGPARSFSQEV